MWPASDRTRSSRASSVSSPTVADYRTESARLNIVLWPYPSIPQKVEEAEAKLATSPLGTGRLWITDSKISHAHDTPDDKRGRIEWMKFTVEIRLPVGK